MRKNKCFNKVSKILRRIRDKMFPPATSVLLAQFSSLGLGSSPTDRTEGSLGRQRPFERRVLFINYLQVVQFLQFPSCLEFQSGNLNHRPFEVDLV